MVHFRVLYVVLDDACQVLVLDAMLENLAATLDVLDGRRLPAQLWQRGELLHPGDFDDVAPTPATHAMSTWLKAGECIGVKKV